MKKALWWVHKPLILSLTTDCLKWRFIALLLQNLLIIEKFSLALNGSAPLPNIMTNIMFSTLNHTLDHKTVSGLHFLDQPSKHTHKTHTYIHTPIISKRMIRMKMLWSSFSFSLSCFLFSYLDVFGVFSVILVSHLCPSPQLFSQLHLIFSLSSPALTPPSSLLICFSCWFSITHCSVLLFYSPTVLFADSNYCLCTPWASCY